MFVCLFFFLFVLFCLVYLFIFFNEFIPYHWALGLNELFSMKVHSSLKQVLSINACLSKHTCSLTFFLLSNPYLPPCYDMDVMFCLGQTMFFVISRRFVSFRFAK